jgi:hypothetical protein
MDSTRSDSDLPFLDKVKLVAFHAFSHKDCALYIIFLTDDPGEKGQFTVIER